MAVTLDSRYVGGFIREHELGAMQASVTSAHEMLHAKSGLGNDFLGWLDAGIDHIGA